MKAEMPPQVESLLELTNQMLNDLGEVPSFVVVYMQEKQGKIAGAILPIGPMMESGMKKDVLAILLRKAAREGKSVVSIAMVNESWVYRGEKDAYESGCRKYGDSLESWPEHLRGEVVTINYQSPVRNEVWSIEIDRSHLDGPRLDIESVDRMNMQGGRFSGFFEPAN